MHAISGFDSGSGRAAIEQPRETFGSLFVKPELASAMIRELGPRELELPFNCVKDLPYIIVSVLISVLIRAIRKHANAIDYRIRSLASQPNKRVSFAFPVHHWREPS